MSKQDLGRTLYKVSVFRHFRDSHLQNITARLLFCCPLLDYIDNEQLSFFLSMLTVKLVLLKAEENSSVDTFHSFFFSTCGIEYVVQVDIFKMINKNTC